MPRKLVTFDWAIKNILRDKANFDILEGFLSELIKTDITIIELLESEGNKETREDRFNRVDLLAKDSNETYILIEVQYEKELDYFHRIMYGSSKLITQYLSENEPYRNVKKVITVHIIYFDIGKGDDYVYEGVTSFTGVHTKNKLELTAKQKKVFEIENVKDIFPKNYIIRVGKYNEKIKDNFDEWVYFLKTGEIKENFKAKNIMKARTKLDILRLDDKSRIEYDN